MENDRRWRKSSYSSSGQDCVELAGGHSAVRDSKHPPQVLEFEPIAMSMFIAAAKAGKLGR
jgi:hypothetical protein